MSTPKQLDEIEGGVVERELEEIGLLQVDGVGHAC
jgi:hypothetical protein